MNLLEFKRFAELKKQYDWLLIESEGNAETSAEPVVRVVDGEALSAMLFSNTGGSSAFVFSPPAKLVNANLEESSKIFPVLASLPIQPIVIMEGTKTQLEPYIKVLNLLGVCTHIDDHTELSGEVRSLNILALLIGIAIGTRGVSAVVSPDSLKITAKDIIETRTKPHIAPAITNSFSAQDESVLNALVKFSEVPLLKYSIQNEIYSKIAAKLSVDEDLLKFEVNSDTSTSGGAGTTCASLMRMLIDENTSTKIAAIIKAVA